MWKVLVKRAVGPGAVDLARRCRNALRNQLHAALLPVRSRVADWLERRRFYGSVRSTDVFLVYFPRSGGFWLQSVFAALRQARAGGGPAAFRYEQIQEQVPELHPWQYLRQPLDRFAALPDPRMFKVHAPADPRFPRVIFLVRDPRDAMLSLYYYRKATESEFPPTLDEFVLNCEPWPGLTWSTYVGPWLELAARRGHLVLKYEDLHADPHPCCRKALAFAGLSATGPELDAAIAEAWQENQRRRADMYRKIVSRYGPGVRDIGTDGVGAYRQEFTPELDRQVCERHREGMERLGYLPAKA